MGETVARNPHGCAENVGVMVYTGLQENGAGTSYQLAPTPDGHLGLSKEPLVEHSLLSPSLVTSVNVSPAETLTRWQLLRDTWQSRLEATSDEGDRLLLLCGLSIADRLIWQLQRDAEGRIHAQRTEASLT